MNDAGNTNEEVVVIATITVKDDKLPELLLAVKANLPHVHSERGCIEYYPAVDVPTDIPVQESNANVVTMVEKWESLQALEDHLKAPHMLIYREQVSDIVESTTIKVLTAAP